MSESPLSLRALHTEHTSTEWSWQTKIPDIPWLGQKIYKIPWLSMSGIDLLKFHDIPEIPWPLGTLYSGPKFLIPYHLANSKQTLWAYLHLVTSCVFSDRISIWFVKTFPFTLGHINVSSQNGYKSSLQFMHYMMEFTSTKATDMRCILFYLFFIMS